MRTLRIFSAIFLAATASAIAQIDLTPIPHEFPFDGIIKHEVNFRAGSALVSYSPPAGWQLSGGGSTLTLIPPNTVQAEAKIVVSGKPASSSWDEDAMKTFRQNVIDSAPKNAEAVKIISEEKNSPQINGHETYEVTIQYALSGEKFEKSVLACNFADEQLQFQLVAHSSAFADLHNTFYGNLYRFDGLK